MPDEFVTPCVNEDYPILYSYLTLPYPGHTIVTNADPRD